MRRYRFGIGIGIIGLTLALCGCSSSGSLSSEEESRATEYRSQGIESFQSEDYQAAADYFAQALAVYGDSYSDACLDTMYYYGQCLYEEGNYNDCIAEMTDLIKNGEKANLADAYLIRGNAYVALGDENSAVTDYEESLKLEGGEYATYCTMYEKFKEAGFTDRAESYLKRLTEAEDADNLMLGKTYYNLGRYSEAENFLKQSEDEGEAEASYYLGLTYEAEEDYSKAEDFYKSYAAAHPEDATICNQYGAYLIRRERYQDALTVIEQGLKLDSSGNEYKALLFNQAVCYEYLSDYSKALKLFQEYLALYPSDTAAAKEVEFLETR